MTGFRTYPEHTPNTVNIIAKPEISVARINAYHISANPDPKITGSDGRRLLDADGNPQSISSPTVLFDSNHAVQRTTLFNYRDFDLERRLLTSYFDRNHRFRNGAFSNLPFRGAIISGDPQFPPDSYESLIRAAATDFAACVKVPYADLRQYAAFHKTPAVLKYIIAHSNAIYSQFQGADANGLTAEVGGPPVRWMYREQKYVPSFEGYALDGQAEMFLHRALWQNRTLGDAGASLLIHGGCNVNSVNETQASTYAQPGYAHWNNAEGLLFYTNGVALFSRAKTFNDAPYGFTDGYRLSDRANFGSCLKSYFNAQANEAQVSTYNIQRKRVYFWSINGDWTLRIRNKNGLGILTSWGASGSLKSMEVHPSSAWIDGWNYNGAVNWIRGIGDVDADERDEFVITSDWGIGILKYDGNHFRALMVAPRDTWFGGWRYDATVNPGRDQIKAVRDFTGSGKSDIMVWSSWGITTLEFAGASLLPSRIYQNGTRLGGWLLNTADNRYQGCGHFDNDRKNDMVITSPWGLGIISLERGTHVYMAPNGTRLGGWMLDTSHDVIPHVADFDGDGLDEILITSPWGIGILKVVAGQLTSIAMHANGSSVDGHIVRNTNTFAVADNLRGGPRKQLVVVDTAGVHVLELGNSRLTRIALVNAGERIDGWVIDPATNQLQPCGDLNGEGRAEMFIRSKWGVGVLSLDTTNHVRCRTLTPYGSMLGDWFLQSSDIVVGAGRLAGGPSNQLLIVKP